MLSTQLASVTADGGLAAQIDRFAEYHAQRQAQLE